MGTTSIFQWEQLQYFLCMLPTNSCQCFISNQRSPNFQFRRLNEDDIVTQPCISSEQIICSRSMGSLSLLVNS